MKVIISFTGLEDRQEALKSKRPFALQPLAGSTILGHILERLQDVPAQSHTVDLNAGADEVKVWAQQFLPDGFLRVVTVNSESVGTPLLALSRCKQVLNDGPLLFVSGSFITEADYAGLISSSADAAFLVQDNEEIIPAENFSVNDAGFYVEHRDLEVFWAGVCWFRSGKDLLRAISSSVPTSITALLSSLNEQGLKISSVKAETCLGTASPTQLLHANARLMQLGYCSEDAIERSYAEEFTVLPPVFLHETAVIENVVIGPFVNLEAGAVVRNSVIRNSLIGTGAQVTDAVLDGSLIGDQAQMNGRKHAVIVGDDARLKLS